MCKDGDMLSVSYEQFAVVLDEKFGQNLWAEFPEIASKGRNGRGMVASDIQVDNAPLIHT